ncbi:MAG TPA: TonB family protein [Marinagarivorans sp.]
MTTIARTETWNRAGFRSLVLFGVLACSPPVAFANGSLNGIDTYNHMGKDYYLVAHYTEQSCYTTPECEQAETPARFTLKITTARWTAHSFSLVWRRELASNNDTVLDNTNLQALLEFTRIAETQLTRGDTIDIAFDGSDTTIAVNKVFAVRAEGKTLFNYIARKWLGPVPPSREFKQRMLAGHGGEHDLTTLAKFNALTPKPARMSLLATWYNEKENAETKPATKFKPTNKSAFELHQPSNHPTTGRPTEPSVAVSHAQQLAVLEWHIHNLISKAVVYPTTERALGRQGKARISFTLNKTLELAGIQSISTEPAESKAFADALKVALQQAQPFSFPPGINTEITTLISTYEHYFTLDSTASAPPKPLAISAATFDQLLHGETRKSIAPDGINADMLKAHIDNHVAYPFWAKRFRVEGTVKALVTLHPDGTVADITLLEGQAHKSLAKAVTAAIQKAAPFSIQANAEALVSFDYQYAFKL